MTSPRSPQERQIKRIKDLDEKWKMLFNEKPRPPLYSVDKYIEYLRKFSSPPLDDSKNGSIRSNGSNVIHNADQQVAYLLKKLKIDLKMSYERFLETFICSPNNGLNLLLTLLKNIQKTSRDNTKGTAKEKMQSKKRILSEELECIQCIKFCLRFKDSVKILLEVPYGLENVAEALLSSNFRSRCTALEVMSKVMMEEKGFHRNLECFTYFRLKNCEPVRFKFLVNMLLTAGSSNAQVAFQLCCMKFLNSLLTSSPDGNTRICLQCEIEMAGLDVKTLLTSVDQKTSEDKEELKKEIIDYRNSLLDVDQLLESHETLYNLNIELQQKVFYLQEQLQMLRRVAAPQQENLDNFHPPQTEHEETIKGLVELDELLDSFDAESNGSSQDIFDNDREETTVDSKKGIVRRGSNRNWKRKGHKLPAMKKIPKDNVQPLSYKYLDPDKISTNEVQYTPHETESTESSDVTVSSLKTTISFIESTRAKKFLEVQQSIGLPVEVIVECLQNFDVEDLGEENVQYLYNLLPTENEMRNIMSLDCDLDSLGDAEQFLVQLMSIDRLEEKIKVMLFLEKFKKEFKQIDEAVVQTCNCFDSLISCEKLKSFIEISKKYLVDNFYTTPLDFKLSLLLKLNTVTTSDERLQAIAAIVQKTNPEILHWYHDVSLEFDHNASLSAILAFKSEAEDGIKLMENELSLNQQEELKKSHEFLSEKLSDFKEHFQEMDKSLKSFCAIYRDNKDSIEPKTLFSDITEFCECYKNIVENLPTTEMTVDEPIPDYMSEVENKGDHSVKSSKELTESDLDSFGLQVTPMYDDKERIKNWIVMTTPTNLVNHDVIREKFSEQIYLTKTQESEGLTKSSEVESESDDSAFEGSGGRFLQKLISADSNDVKQRSSTPLNVFATNEPEPDYSRSNSPDPKDDHFDDVGSEVSRILREFEGDLNGYETHITTPVHRRFYTIHSIINL